jgi:hypothetical protein
MVSFNNEGFENLGLTKNISKEGVCIASEKELPSKTEVHISIAVPGEVLDLKGEVVWCKESSNDDDNVPDSIGIRITEAPPEYLNFVEYVKHQNVQKGRPEF